MLRKFAFLGGGMASIALATLSIAVDQPAARAACLIADGSSYTDRPYNQADVIASFAGSNCTAVTLTQDTTFYRYYSFPLSPNVNKGRYLTSDFFDLNSEAIVKLALYPFPPNVQFQNFAYFREEVLVTAGTTLYQGIAGPQPVSDPNSCYAGGASQFFYDGPNVSNNSNITFTYDADLTRDTRYINPYGVGDPCGIQVPEPSPISSVGAIAALGFAAVFHRSLTAPKRRKKSFPAIERISVKR
ncbi:hypothetical protein V0288_05570 [Pannus brasiliensis CCIBt3594]|uniref:PEP-CTERM sorting domain-containing protein n=1 Tax=Pannus brasiliensis CCIBt3594 TaxID=1427578 RepID=A0AAW9QRM5_9CHRO